MDRLERWMSEQCTHNVNLVKKFISLPINPPILSPLAVCGCGSDLLFMSDMEQCAIFEVSIKNNGAVLKGIVLSEIKLNSTALGKEFHLVVETSTLPIRVMKVD